MTLTPEEIFDGYCRSAAIGPRYSPTDQEPGWFVGLVEQVRYRSNRTAQRLFQKMGVNSIHVDVVASSDFNAFAASASKMQLVAITSTVLGCLYPLAGLIARFYTQRPSPQIATLLRETRWTDKVSVSRCIERLLADGPLVPHGAQQMHTELFWYTVGVILQHEYAHLYLGHVGYLNAKLGMTTMAERRKVDDTEMARAMEIQADIGICMYLLGAKASQLELCLLASIVVFSLLYELNDNESESHPHPLVRQHLLINRLGNETGMSDDSFNAVIHKIQDSVRPASLGFFERPSNMTIEAVDRAAKVIETASNETYIPLFEPYRLSASS